MSFSVPKFNLTVNVWNGADEPPGAPTFVVKGNLAYGRRTSPSGTLDQAEQGLTMQLLLPAGTDAQWAIQGVGPSVMEVPAGSGRFYVCAGVDDVGKGWSNEHRVALLIATSDYGYWPIPMP
jgi:hypothetical protein